MAYDPTNLKKQIQETEEWLQRELAGVRTGRATPALLDSVKPEAYGTKTPITQLGSVSIEDARTLRIVPWDKSVSKNIEKAIIDADFGVSVAVDDAGLRVIFPELTAERRTLLTKLAHDKHEQAKVTLRGHRTDAIKEIESLQKDGMGEDVAKRNKDEVQKLIDGAGEKFAITTKKKEEEIAQ